MRRTPIHPPLPKHLRIAGVRWQVESCTRGMLFEQHERDLLGVCMHHSCTIQILNTLRPDHSASVLLHEILHAVAESVGHDLDEEQVTAIANGLIAVLRDSPGLVAYLTQE